MRKVKRAAAFISAAVMAFSLAACSTQGGRDTAADTQAVQNEETSQAETSQTGEGEHQAAQEAGEESSAEGVNYADMTDTSIVAEPIVLTEEWDKVFPLSDEVNHRKVTFVNHFGITLAADLYEPKEYTGQLPAIAVCGPFGAVKEQASGFYAQTMAERGFLTLAFDPSFTGESVG